MLQESLLNDLTSGEAEMMVGGNRSPHPPSTIPGQPSRPRPPRPRPPRPRPRPRPRWQFWQRSLNGLNSHPGFMHIPSSTQEFD